MTIELRELARVGGVTVAALVRSSVTGATRPGLFVHASKTPVAVLVHDNKTTAAYWVGGESIPLTEFDIQFPGKREAFERMTASAS